MRGNHKMEELTQGYILNERYEIHEKIGEGGMAFVYRGVDLQTQNIVALKILKKEFCYDDEFIKRFKNEAAAAQKLSHPNIVAIYDMGNDEDIHYIVREYIDGLTLDELIKAKKKLPWRNTLKISAQILSAVDHAHKNNIVHRDIKPLNVMITAEGEVKLTDFGIARAVSSATKSAANDSAGSVHYLSPEQVRGGYVDERSDIYSIGITMYEMVTGSVPYDGDSHVSIAMQHIDGKIKPPSEVDPKIPYGVSDLIVLATKKETNMRFQSAGEMYEQLLKVMKNPYLSFLSNYAETQILPEEIADDEPILTEEGETVINDYGIKEEKDAMVKDVILQTVTYLFAVIASILVAFFVISMFTYAKDSLKKYDIVEYKVENYVGMSAAAVNSVFKENDIEVKQEIVINEEYPAGYIIKQSVDPGKVLKVGESITFYVAAKEGSVILEDFSGQSFQHVGTSLETKELIVEYKELNSAKYADGKIIRTSPGVGSILEKGDKITIYYSTGQLNKTVKVPNLKGMTLEEAQQALMRNDVGLKLGVVYPSPSSIIDGLFPTPTPTEKPSPSPTEEPTIDVTSAPTEEVTQTPEQTQETTPTDESVLFTEEENVDNDTDTEATPTVDATVTVTPGESETPGISPTLGEETQSPSTPTPENHIYAHDRVVSQYPPAGTEIMIGETVNVYFYDLTDILPRKDMTIALPTVTPTPSPTLTVPPTGEAVATQTPTPTPTQTPTPTPTPTLSDPDATIKPTIHPDSFIKTDTCSIRIEAVVEGMSRPAEIVYMSSELDLQKFPIRFNVPLSVTGAPTKVYVYLAEAGKVPTLYKVINVYG